MHEKENRNRTQRDDLPNQSVLTHVSFQFNSIQFNWVIVLHEQPSLMSKVRKKFEFVENCEVNERKNDTRVWHYRKKNTTEKRMCMNSRYSQNYYWTNWLNARKNTPKSVHKAADIRMRLSLCDIIHLSVYCSAKEYRRKSTKNIDFFFTQSSRQQNYWNIYTRCMMCGVMRKREKILRNAHTHIHMILRGTSRL